MPSAKTKNSELRRKEKNAKTKTDWMIEIKQIG